MNDFGCLLKSKGIDSMSALKDAVDDEDSITTMIIGNERSRLMTLKCAAFKLAVTSLEALTHPAYRQKEKERHHVQRLSSVSTDPVEETLRTEINGYLSKLRTESTETVSQSLKSKADNQVTYIFSKPPSASLSHPPIPREVASPSVPFSDLPRQKGITLSASELLSLSNARDAAAVSTVPPNQLETLRTGIKSDLDKITNNQVVAACSYQPQFNNQALLPLQAGLETQPAASSNNQNDEDVANTSSSDSASVSSSVLLLELLYDE